MKVFKLLLFALLLVPAVINAQSPAVESALKSRFSRVQYNKECGGWYFLSRQTAGQTLFGFADAQGNVVVSEATKYERFPGFIKFYLLDETKKAKHDQWIADMQQYNRDYQEYKRIEVEYENELSAYNAKVEAAREEANVLYQRRRQAAIKKAEQEQKAQQQQNKSNNIWVGILQGINNGISTATAANSVKFDPIFKEVLANRGLTVAPARPYNPVPSQPKEPESGYYWASFPLRQPSPYTYVDYDNIADGNGFANVSINGKWGLVDAYFNEIIACSNSSKVYRGLLCSNRHHVLVNGECGVIDNKGKFIIKPTYTSIETEGDNLIVMIGNKKGMIDKNGKEIMPCQFEAINKSNSYLLCNKGGKWGCYTSDFQELYPCQFQDLSFSRIGKRLFLLTQERGLWGVTDFQTGKEILPNNYSDIQKSAISTTEEAFMVKKDNLYGIYLQSGVLLLPCEYESIKKTTLGKTEVFQVTKNGASGLYEINGNPIVSEELGYEQIDFNTENNFYIVKKNGMVGVCSAYGEEMVPCIYKELKYNQKLHGFIAKKDDFTRGVVSLLGKEVVPFRSYSNLEFNQGNNYFVTGYYKHYGAVDFDGNVILKDNCKNYATLSKRVMKYEKKVNLNEPYQRVMEILRVSEKNYKDRLEVLRQERSTFSFYAQNYVERIINNWQRRGEFEKTEAWRARVNNETRKQKVYTLTKEAQDEFIKLHEQNLPEDEICIVGDYDTDNEVYRISSKIYAGKDILVPVNIDDAMEFKTSFGSLKKQPKFFIENDQVAVAEYTFTMPNGNVYKYNNQASLVYNIANVEYQFDDITIDRSAANKDFKGGKQTFSTTSITLGTSDVDVMIPQAQSKKENTFAIIIANENYEHEKNVEFAYNDGATFKDYCIKALGLPADNVHFHANATLNDMRFAVNWVKDVAKAYEGKAKFIIYYAGHGVPSDDQQDAFLLPVDGFCSDLGTGYKLSTFYEMLGEIPSEGITVFLDACFSGSQRSGEVMASTRGVAIATRIKEPKGNVVVCSAASKSQTAHPYNEKSHGLFTYFLLKKLQSSNGEVSLGDLTDYIKTEVPKISVTVSKKTQTPNVSVSNNLRDSWRTIKL